MPFKRYSITMRIIVVSTKKAAHPQSGCAPVFFISLFPGKRIECFSQDCNLNKVRNKKCYFFVLLLPLFLQHFLPSFLQHFLQSFFLQSFFLQSALSHSFLHAALSQLAFFMQHSACAFLPRLLHVLLSCAAPATTMATAIIVVMIILFIAVFLLFFKW